MLYYTQPLGTSAKKMSVTEIKDMLDDIRKKGKHDRNAATNALEVALIDALYLKINKRNDWINRKVKNASI